MLKYFTAKKCQNNHNGNINDHWSQITVTKRRMKKFEIPWELSKCARNIKWANAVGKWHWKTCLTQDCYRLSICKNKVTVKWNKAKCQ